MKKLHCKALSFLFLIFMIIGFCSTFIDLFIVKADYSSGSTQNVLYQEDSAPYSVELQTAATDNSLETISDYGKTEAVQINQIDYYGNEIQIVVERKKYDSKYTYFLADNLRNINILNNTKDNNGNGLQAGRLIAVDIEEEERISDIFTDKIAVTIFANLVKTWDFYADENNFGSAIFGIDPKRPINNVRCDALQNSEIEIIALAHYGTEWENAGYFSSGKINPNKAIFAFGDGKPSTLYDLGAALDIVGHEYQHAITTKITPLVYKGESGALNEAYSDIFAALIQNYEMNDDRFWLIGEDIAGTIYRGALRDIKNPARLGNPNHMDNRFIDINGQNPNKEVHLNSNIITHSLYNMYLKSVSMNFEIFTKQLIGKLYLTALSLLTTTASFSEFRFYLDLAAQRIGLIDSDRETLREIIAYGFDRVGVFCEEVSNPEDYLFVSYYDIDNNLLRSDRVPHPENSTPPSIAASFTKGRYYYSFSGWKKEQLESGDLIFRASYKRILTKETKTVIFIISVFIFATFTLFLTISCIKNFKTRDRYLYSK